MANDKEFQNIEDFLNPDQTPTATEGTQPAATEGAQPTGTEGTQSTGTEGTEGASGTEGTEGTTAKTTETPDKTTEDKTKTQPNPMKELRDKANAAQKLQQKIDSAINRLSDGDYNFKLKDFKNDTGKVDYDALIKAMDDADVKQRAEARGLTPELQAEIEKYEKEKKEVEIAKARVQMDRQLNNFQMEQQLSPDDLNSFISDAMKLGINPLSIAALDKTSKGTTALKLLYQAVYTDKIVQKAVEKALADAEAKRQADAAAKGGQPKANPAASNANKTNKTDSKGIALDDFLGSL